METDTYLNCLLRFQDEGVKTIIDAEGTELPIECAIEHALHMNHDAKEYSVMGNRIVRHMAVMVALKAVAS